MNRAALTVLGVGLSTLPAFAQGSDSCATAQVVSGPGPHMFDNSAATTDGAPDVLCYSFGTAQIENDVWFEWTAPSSGVFVLTTCAMTTVDTKIAVYETSCAGAIQGCNDDTCTLQSEIDFMTTAGTPYIIRIGTFPGATGGTGDFTVQLSSPVFNPGNGHWYLEVTTGLTQTWNQALAAAAASSFMGMPGHLVTITDAAENAFLDRMLGDLSWHWVGGFQDLNDPGYFEPDGAWKWITGEPMTYTNWWPGEPNNMGGSGAEDFMEVLHGGQFGALSWNDVADFDDPRGYVIEYEPGGGLGMNYCGPAIPNSTGFPGEMSASGSPLVVNNDVTLMADQLPSGQFGYFLTSQTQGFFNPPGSSGFICLGGNIGRYNGNVGQGPSFSLQIDLTAMPVNPPAPVLPGDTWNFQAWYRDVGNTNNFTDGLSIQFL